MYFATQTVLPLHRRSGFISTLVATGRKNVKCMQRTGSKYIAGKTSKSQISVDFLSYDTLSLLLVLKMVDKSFGAPRFKSGRAARSRIYWASRHTRLAGASWHISFKVMHVTVNYFWAISGFMTGIFPCHHFFEDAFSAKTTLEEIYY